jgi:hypothetical protein
MPLRDVAPSASVSELPLTEPCLGAANSVVRDALTLDRWEEIEGGLGAPATEAELAQLTAWKKRMAPAVEKLQAGVAAIGETLEAKLAPVVEVVEDYQRLPRRERMKFRHWTLGAYALRRSQSRPCWTRSRSRSPRGRRHSVRQRARSPGRQDPPEEPEPDIARARRALRRGPTPTGPSAGSLPNARRVGVVSRRS